MQGIKTDEGNYGPFRRWSTVLASEVLTSVSPTALRFTEETERGDNSTIKAPSLKEARPLRPPLEAPAENAGVRRRRRTPKVAVADGGAEGSATA